MRFGRDRGPVDPEVEAARAQARQRRKIIVGLAIIVLLVVGYLIGAAFLPRWWARTVSNWVQDSFTKGTLYGLAIGLVFTLVPLAVAALAFIRRLNNKARAAILVLAVALAIPNLLTLGIAIGSGGGAHAASRKLDTDAPFFRGASLIGALVGLAIFLLSIWQYRAGRRVRQAKRAAKARQKTGAATVETAGPPASTPPRVDGANDG
jgi:MFS family permease